jgi:hypothetical protein
MIGDQRHTEALEAREIRLPGLVGEHCGRVEAAAKAHVEWPQERMQT